MNYNPVLLLLIFLLKLSQIWPTTAHSKFGPIIFTNTFLLSGTLSRNQINNDEWVREKNILNGDMRKQSSNFRF